MHLAISSMSLISFHFIALVSSVVSVRKKCGISNYSTILGIVFYVIAMFFELMLVSCSYMLEYFLLRHLKMLFVSI